MHMQRTTGLIAPVTLSLCIYIVLLHVYVIYVVSYRQVCCQVCWLNLLFFKKKKTAEVQEVQSTYTHLCWLRFCLWSGEKVQSPNFKVQEHHLLAAQVGFRGFRCVCSDMRASLGMRDRSWDANASAALTAKPFRGHLPRTYYIMCSCQWAGGKAEDWILSAVVLKRRFMGWTRETYGVHFLLSLPLSLSFFRNFLLFFKVWLLSGAIRHQSLSEKRLLHGGNMSFEVN